MLTPLIDEKNVCRERTLQNYIPSRIFGKCQRAVKASLEKLERTGFLR